MSGRGEPTFAEVVAECWRRPGLLVRELAWRWLYGIPALAVIAYACYHIYFVTSGALQAAGASQISLDTPWQSAATVAALMPVVRPVIAATALWLVPLLGLGWAVAAGFGRNVVFRHYERSLPWRPLALSCIQGIRAVALAATVALWWGTVRWSAAVSTAAGVPNVPMYFALVAVFTLAFLVIWSLSSWGFQLAPLFLLLDRQTPGASLRRGFQPSAVTGRLVGVNVAVAILRLGMALFAMILSALPLGFLPPAQSTALYVWLAAVTVLYLVASGFFNVVRLAAFVRFWRPAETRQNQASQPFSDHVN